MTWIIIYVLSAIACGALHWAEYRNDQEKFQHDLPTKVMHLYIVPLLPVLNTAMMAKYVLEYIGLW